MDELIQKSSQFVLEWKCTPCVWWNVMLKLFLFVLGWLVNGF